MYVALLKNYFYYSLKKYITLINNFFRQQANIEKTSNESLVNAVKQDIRIISQEKKLLIDKKFDKDQEKNYPLVLIRPC